MTTVGESMAILRSTAAAMMGAALIGCGAQDGAGSGPRPGADPIDVVGATTADVSTFQGYVEALVPAFASGDDAAMAAVMFPNREMMEAFILRHYGAANAQAAIELLDTTMPADLNDVLTSAQQARQAAIDSGFDPENATFESAEMISGLSIGGMKMNTLGMNIRSGDRVFAFELSEARDILGRWVSVGDTEFVGVTGATPLQGEDGGLNLDL